MVDRSKSERRVGRRAFVKAVVIALGALTLVADARGDSFDQRGVWLPRGDALAGALKVRPRRFIDNHGLSPDRLKQVRLGAVLFRSPALLGLEARRIGMSCETCHSGGHVNAGFFLPGLSSRNGTVDLSSKTFHRPADDGRFNPLRIPSLRGVGDTPPYGHQGRFATLAAFAKHVIVDEFGGAEPSARVLKALVAFLAVLKRPPNAMLDSDGRLTSRASAAARRGERLFYRPGRTAGRQPCVSCHIPSLGFTDRRRHDVGTGGAIDTPSLLGATVGPYLHDGRFDLLGRTAGYFARRYGVASGTRELADITAYLRAVGAAANGTERVTLARDLAEVVLGEAVLSDILERRAPTLLALAMPVLRRDLGRIHDRFSDADHAVHRGNLIAWSRKLQSARAVAEAGNIERAQRLLRDLQVIRIKWMQALRAAEATSLYDPARLDRFLAARRRHRRP